MIYFIILLQVCACTNHGLPADVWSLGATIVRMINGEKPYHELGAANDMAIIYKVHFAQNYYADFLYSYISFIILL